MSAMLPSLVVHMVRKELACSWPIGLETQVWSLGQEDPLEKGDSHGQRRLADSSSWDCKELDITEQLILSLSFPAWATVNILETGILDCPQYSSSEQSQDLLQQ